MRVLDLIAALEQRPSRIVDATPGRIAIEPLIGGIPCVVAAAVEVGPNDLVVVAVGGDPPAYSDLAEELRNHVALPAGAAFLALSGRDLVDLSVPLVLAWADESGAEIVAAERLPYRWFSSGVMLSIQGQRDSLRIGNEVVLRGALQRDLAEQVRGARSDRDEAVREHLDLRRRLGHSDAEIHRLRHGIEALERRVTGSEAAAKEAEADVVEARREAQKIQSSTAYQLGRTLLQALKPSRRTLLLPRDLWRLFRGRGAWREQTADGAPARPITLPGEQPRDQRLLAAFRSIPTPAQPPLIAGVFSRTRAAHLSESVPTLAMWPNDIDQMFDRAEPTVLVIESAAAGPGEPWVGLGSPSGVSGSIALGQVIEAAGRRGVPTVFWWTSPSHRAPGLRRIADRCDLVAIDPTVPGVDSGTPIASGVSLSRFNPPPPSESRDGPPLIHLGAYDVDPRHDASDPILRAGLELGAEVRFDPSTQRPMIDALYSQAAAATYRSAPWAIAGPAGTVSAGACPSRALALIACGTPVVARVGSIDDHLVDGFIQIRGADDLAVAVEHATSRVLSADQVSTMLRHLWRTSTPEAQMRRLLAAVDADVGAIDAANRIGVRVDGDVAGVVDAILRQSHRPVEILIDGHLDAATEGPVGELAAAGIEIRQPADATTEVQAVWTGTNGNGWSHDHLANLLVARVTSGLDRLDSESGPLLESPNPAAASGPAPWWVVGSP